MVSCVDDWNVGGGSSAENESQSIVYNVPLYAQGQTNLCWAFCMVMRKSYYDGTDLSQKQALQAAKELGELYHILLNWNSGLPFYRLGRKVKINEIEDLYTILQENGPIYAAYRKQNIIGGHVVLVTGVDIENGQIFTNNPWGVQGTQNEADFKRGFVGYDQAIEPGYWLSGLYIPFS